MDTEFDGRTTARFQDNAKFDGRYGLRLKDTPEIEHIDFPWRAFAPVIAATLAVLVVLVAGAVLVSKISWHMPHLGIMAAFWTILAVLVVFELREWK